MTDFTNGGLETDISEEEDGSVYLSIGDLMSGLLMFFALLFITALLQLAERDEPKRVVIGNVVEAMQSKNIDVKVNPDNGDISIRESILFDKGSAELKPQGKAFLRDFIPAYSDVILSKPEFDKEVSRVVIEGHTSSAGDYKDNMELSLRRSASVTRFIFDEMKFSKQERFSQKILAAGRGEIEAEDRYDKPSDRKVVFRFQFRSEEVGDKLRKKTSKK
ncbi:membrane protein [Dulcicalothrix desertica PCC 7102]|uniref:Membrane protein n=1 Tax=Dulcicalothrix desertica PCC 7102 TaxID=232991 RepID=A0A3S1CPU1_9CYAN|nr:OmpA family protein [Dulcicalothrix desertica]RUT08177.1 membrane protein [Dulcicalothrix desertica PCC 7102]TWH40049.1 Flagellar motor protein [Dulcicalothrix desertica PCC 7102]